MEHNWVYIGKMIGDMDLYKCSNCQYNYHSDGFKPDPNYRIVLTSLKKSDYSETFSALDTVLNCAEYQMYRVQVG